MTEITALQKAVADVLEVGLDKVDFDDRVGIFYCRCGKCNDMIMTGGLVQGLYESGQLHRLKEKHDHLVAGIAAAIAKTKAQFKRPPKEVLKWLTEAGVDVNDLYRLRVLRRKDGGGEVGLWLFCKNKEGHVYLGADRLPARRAFKMTCKELPDFVEDEYGQPLSMYNDETVLPVK
jgi:hypothetical protein